jgi:uncharacterized RDD family membrane protein YckC
MKASLSSNPGHEMMFRLARLFSVLIDCIALLLMLKLILVNVDGLWESRTTRGDNPQTIGILSPWLGILIFLFISLYINKDIIRGQSIAKQIMKFQIVSNSTGKVATIYQCFIRNLFLFFLGPIEVIMSTINPSRRIGDIVAGTKLVDYDPGLEQPQLKFLQIITCIILPVLFLTGISYLCGAVNFN